MIRVTFRARDNGQEFPVYFNDEAEVAEAAAALDAEVVFIMHDVSEALMLFEQIAALEAAVRKED